MIDNFLAELEKTINDILGVIVKYGGLVLYIGFLLSIPIFLYQVNKADKIQHDNNALYEAMQNYENK